MVNNLFLAIAIIILVATLFAFLARLLRQPLIPAYIISGLMIGPAGLAMAQATGIPFIINLFTKFSITNNEFIILLSEFGITLLLFIVGLEMDFKKLKSVASISLIGGTIQASILFLSGMLIGFGLGYSNLSAVYMGLIITFSSTAIIIKILSDNKEIDTLHGRIVIGILLLEDFFAIFALTVLATLSEFNGVLIAASVVKAALLMIIAWLASKYVFPKLFEFAAERTEVLFLASVAICFLFAAAFAAIGLSMIIGAFVAGVVLGNLEYNLEIIGHIKPLKDFFATIFFVSIGLNVVPIDMSTIVMPIILLILMVTVIKPIMIQINCGLFGYKRKVGFLSAFTMTQISEFALIIVAQGLLLGHIDQSIFSIAIVVSLVTTIFTSYIVKYSHSIYDKVKGTLGIFERLSTFKHGYEYEHERNKKYDVVLCGYNRIGYNVLHTLNKKKKKVLVVDYNPEVIKMLTRDKQPCIYGDIGDFEIREKIVDIKPKMLISTIVDPHENALLLSAVKRAHAKCLVIVTATEIDDALALYEHGADYVILPKIIGGEHVSHILERYSSIRQILKKKIDHIVDLKHRKTHN